MPECFVPLAVYLREPAEVSPPAIAETPAPVPPVSEPELESYAQTQELIAEVKRARAALADALDVALCDLLRDVAASVVGRELSIAPSQIATIVARALERFESEMPVAVHVHPGDAPALDDASIAVVADETLRRGDATIVVRSGTIDASLGVRLEEVLRNHGAW